MSFIAAAVIGSAVVGAVVQNKAQKKAQKQTDAAMRAQEIIAQNAASVKSTKVDAGAKVHIGAAALDPNDKSSTKGRAKKRTITAAPLGGVSASTLGGL